MRPSPKPCRGDLPQPHPSPNRARADIHYNRYTPSKESLSTEPKVFQRPGGLWGGWGSWKRQRPAEAGRVEASRSSHLGRQVGKRVQGHSNRQDLFSGEAHPIGVVDRQRQGEGRGQVVRHARRRAEPEEAPIAGVGETRKLCEVERELVGQQERPQDRPALEKRNIPPFGGGLVDRRGTSDKLCSISPDRAG